MIKNWTHDSKINARQATIIDPYHTHFGSFPADAQYWTMCGQCDKPGCEFDQIQSLIEPHQFHGVEIDAEVHALNLAANMQGHWYNDDFYRAMQKTQARGQFNPAIVNADLIQMADAGAPYVGRIMSLVLGYDVMLVANFVLKTRHHEQTGGEVIDRLEKNPHFQVAMNGGWEYADFYAYSGADGSGKTVMGSFIFVQHQKKAMAA